MSVKLYVLPASHPCAAVEAALRLKGIEFERVDLLPMTQMMIGPLRYGGATVPGMRIDGERIVGSRAIMRRLDELAPAPALLPPPGDERRERVLAAERWGDEVLQSVPRRIIDVAFLRKPRAMESYVGDARLPLPRALMAPAMPLTARLMAVKNRARDATAQADIAALPSQLDRVDAWIEEGLIGGPGQSKGSGEGKDSGENSSQSKGSGESEGSGADKGSGEGRPNAADLQIGSTIRLLMSIGDVRPLIADRPAAKLADWFPPLLGEVPAGVLPAAWLTAQAPART